MFGPVTNLHYAPNGNFVNGQYVPGSDGFNLADVSSVAQLNSLPPGVKGLVWLNMTGGVTASFQSTVSQFIGNPNLYGFYLADEPDPSLVSAANLKAESDWIHANVPGAKTFIVLLNMGSPTNPSYLNTYNSANTDIDLFGLDPYPIRPQFNGGTDYNVITSAVSAAEAAGIAQDQIVPVYQAFGGGSSTDPNYTSYTLPTASQEQQILSTWASVVPAPAFDMAYSWGIQSGDAPLAGSAALQQVFAAHNAPVSNTTAVTSIIASASAGILNIGDVATITVDFSGTVIVSGTPTLALNDDGIATYIGGSGTNALAFSYTVGSSDTNVASLAATSFNLDNASIQDSSGLNANLSLYGLAQSGPQIVTSTSTIPTSFSGISDVSSYPPHNALAVGPSNVVTAEGSRIAWTSLTGSNATNQSVYSFFGSLGSTLTNSLFDPQIVYDSVNHRYIVTIDNIGSGGTISNIDIAVSKDSNPNDGWYFASLNTSLIINNQLTSSDQPRLSADGTNIYITASQYNVNVSGYAGTECWVIGDTAGAGGGIYNGGSLTVIANQIAPSSQGIIRVVAGNSGYSYYVSAYSTGNGTDVIIQSYDATTATFGAASSFNLDNSDQGDGGSNYTAQQQGTNLLLDVGGTQLQGIAYANGFLYGVSEVRPVGSSAPEIHWFKIDVSNPGNPILVAQGDIPGTAIGANVAVFDASVAVDGSGDVVINFTASGPNMYPADYYVYDRGTDSSYSFSAPIPYQASSGFFNSNATGAQRWGPESSAIADPANPNGFWLSGEYVANGWWQTSVAQVAISTALASRPAAPGIVDASDVNGYVNAANDTAAQALTGTAGANDTVNIYLNGATAPAYTTQANGSGNWSQTIGVLANGTYSYVATATDVAGNVSAPSVPLAFTVDTTAPTITINTIASNNIINASKAASGFSISGSTTGAQNNGQIVTVKIINSSNVVVDSYTTADNSNAWTVSVTSAQATALADGSFTVTANVSDKAGNPAPQATHALTVDEDKSPEPPALMISKSALTVAAGGSIPLGITATSVDSDDRLSVTISGVPSYETITAPSGDTVSKVHSNGTYTWTITENSSATGQTISGLALKSNYKGTGHPTATLTITASNVTSGETATSAAETILVTDPPQVTSSSPATAVSTASNIDLGNLRFSANTTLANGVNSGGIMTASDGAHVANIALLGQYTVASFAMASDGHGGTLITDPAMMAQSQLAKPHA
jgi:hypothetical protein